MPIGNLLRDVATDIFGLGEPQITTTETSGTEFTRTGREPFSPQIQQALNRRLQELLARPTPQPISREAIFERVRGTADRYLADQRRNLFGVAAARGGINASNVGRLNRQITADVAANLARDLPSIYEQELQNEITAYLQPFQGLQASVGIADLIQPRATTTDTRRTGTNTTTQSVDPIAQLFQLGGTAVGSVAALKLAGINPFANLFGGGGGGGLPLAPTI